MPVPGLIEPPPAAPSALPAPLAPSATPPILDVRELRTTFRTDGGVVRAADGVSFSLAAGRVLGLVGESGCGKSVSALSVLRLIPDPPGRIEAGEILWRGRDLLALPMRDMPSIRGREIAMIFQDPMTSLNPVFTIGRQLTEVLERHFAMRGAEARERATEALVQVGIADPADRLLQYPHELSGGMKQRVMIAMALLCRPSLLIADEPTTALDVTIQAQILRLMKDLQRQTGMTILLITHDLGVVAETCDEVNVMYAGRVVERAGVIELFERPAHPYTRGLLASLPMPGLARATTPLATIEGTVPSLIDLPKGCRFADRCPRRRALCDEQYPPERVIRPGHAAACHFPLESGK